MYFSEVTELDSTQKRSFQVYVNDKSSSVPIIPPYGSVSEWLISNMTAASNTTFALKATNDSTLPPIINALEVFTVSNALTDGTNSNDVEGLALLKTAFNVLQDWSGDPCLPAPFTLDWIKCSDNATPRVTALCLSSFDLSGWLPEFSSMDALQTIDLHNNSLEGSIPDFLGSFPNLTELNLADNDFSGFIPTSLSKNDKLKLVVSGNPNLCVSGNSCQSSDPGTYSNNIPSTTSLGRSKKKSSKLPVILGSTIPSFTVFGAIMGLLVVLHNRRKTAAFAATSAGQTGGANRPNGTPQPQGSAFNLQMAGKIAQATINELRVNIHEQTTSEIIDQMNSQTNEGEMGSTNA